MNSPLSQPRPASFTHRGATAALLAAALSGGPWLSAYAQANGPAPLDDEAGAEPVADITVPEGPVVTEGLIMNFDQATLKTVLDYLSEEAKLIIVNEVELEGRITMFNRSPVSLDQAISVLNTVLYGEGYTAVRRGQVLKIVSLEDAKSQSIPVRVSDDPDSVPETDTIITMVVPLKFANADEVQDDLEDLINDDYAEMTANQSSNAIIITDTEANVRRIMQIIVALDQSIEKVTEIKVFKLDFADADDTARLIESTFQQQASEDEIFGRMIQQRFGQGGGGRGGRGGDNNQQSGGGPGRASVTAEADTRTNSVVVSASPEMMVQIEAIIDDLDSDTTAKDSVLIYDVKNMQATELADVFNELFDETGSSGSNNNNQRFGGGGGFGSRVQAANAVAATGNSGAADLVGQVNAVANESSNTLLVLTPEKNFERVQEILDQLDKPVPQVLIRVLVSEVTYDDSLDFGVEFEGINVGGAGVDSNILTDFDLFDSTLGLNYLLFDSQNFRAAVRALHATGRFDVLSRPYLLTADNQEASINVGQDVPIPTNSRVDESGDIITTIDYRNVGITLTVTPQINSEGLVVMDVSQIITAVADQAVPIAPDQNALVFTNRTLDTQVAVAHGQTVVIGGLVQDQLTETIRGVPILRDIPIIGNLFKRTERSKVKTELLLFLTPEVIEDPQQLTPASEKIKGESETLDNAYEPGRLQQHLDKLQATQRPAADEDGTDNPPTQGPHVQPDDDTDDMQMEPGASSGPTQQDQRAALLEMLDRNSAE